MKDRDAILSGSDYLVGLMLHAFVETIAPLTGQLSQPRVSYSGYLHAWVLSLLVLRLLRSSAAAGIINNASSAAIYVQAAPCINILSGRRRRFSYDIFFLKTTLTWTSRAAPRLASSFLDLARRQ